MKSSLIIKVEILAGTHLREAAQEMITLRQKLGVNIEGSFNGVNLYVGHNTKNVDEIEQEYDREIKEKHKETE